MFSFDGSDPSACDQVGVTHQNNPPYTWEEDEGPGAFVCAPTLAQPGAHRLVVTPFDGNDCSGAMGAPVTLDFQVVAPDAPPPPDPEPTLSAPGRPFLVE
jgi:hypothetical protein